MKFVSTRGASPTVNCSEAMCAGLAPDGGLYVPTVFPHIDPFEMEGLQTPATIGARLLRPFFQGDRLEIDLEAICEEALNFPIPLKSLGRETAVLELFHGPTAAFKDVGARFLAECIRRLQRASLSSEGTEIETVLVATSGDTGGAVAGAFFGKPGIEVLILFPKGRISARQEKQLTCWGGNVRAFAVRGTFDDCQKIVKEAFADPWWRAHKRLISANSINIGRLLPQMIHHAKAGLEHWRATGRVADFIVPSGNLGNAVAALWAKRVGMPMGRVILATNANRTVSTFFETGRWNSQAATITTLANAMDVGRPSNMERLLKLYPNLEDLKNDVAAVSVSDAEISETIRHGKRDWGEIWCPHTATAVFAREQLREKRAGVRDGIVVATAHPAKFDSIVEPLIGESVPVPPELKALLDRPSVSVEIEPALAAFRAALTFS